MTAGFQAEPGHVAGFANAAGALVAPTIDVATHVQDQAVLPATTSGLLGECRAPIDAYAEATWRRIYGRCDHLDALCTELNRAAWVYDEQEGAAQRVLGPVGQDLGRADFPSPKSYGTDSYAPLPPPPCVGGIDLSDTVSEVGGAIAGIEWVLEKVFEYSLVEDIAEPISGNYNELDQAGGMLIQAGDRAESIAGDLRAQLATLRSHWSGGAADACAGYVDRLAAALAYEGPLNRVVGELYQAAAAEFSRVGELIARILNHAIEQITKAAAAAAVPVAGWVVGGYRAVEAAKAVKSSIDETLGMLECLRAMNDKIDTVTTIAAGEADVLELPETISGLAEPCGYHKQEDASAEPTPAERLAAAMDVTRGVAEHGSDAWRLAENVRDFTDAPEDTYHLGARPGRPGA